MRVNILNRFLLLKTHFSHPTNQNLTFSSMINIMFSKVFLKHFVSS